MLFPGAVRCTAEAGSFRARSRERSRVCSAPPSGAALAWEKWRGGVAHNCPALGKRAKQAGRVTKLAPAFDQVAHERHRGRALEGSLPELFRHLLMQEQRLRRRCD